MSIPVEKGEHNGDDLDRIEEVRSLIRQLHTNMTDRASLGSWHCRSIKSYLSLPKALHSED